MPIIIFRVYYVKLRNLKFPEGGGGGGPNPPLDPPRMQLDLSVNLCNGVWKIVTLIQTNCFIKAIVLLSLPSGSIVPRSEK